MEEIYGKRANGRYYKLGYAWTGFPADGIWLVQDGMHRQSLLIGSKERVPVFALNYRLHEDGIVAAVQGREKEVGHGISLFEIARIACDYFAHVVAEEWRKI